MKPISRKVDKLSCVRFGSARYSVPNRLIGTTVLIAVADGDGAGDGAVHRRARRRAPAGGAR